MIENEKSTTICSSSIQYYRWYFHIIICRAYRVQYTARAIQCTNIGTINFWTQSPTDDDTLMSHGFIEGYFFRIIQNSCKHKSLWHAACTKSLIKRRKLPSDNLCYAQPKTFETSILSRGRASSIQKHAKRTKHDLTVEYLIRNMYKLVRQPTVRFQRLSQILSINTRKQ